MKGFINRIRRAINGPEMIVDVLREADEAAAERGRMLEDIALALSGVEEWLDSVNTRHRDVSARELAHAQSCVAQCVDAVVKLAGLENTAFRASLSYKKMESASQRIANFANAVTDTLPTANEAAAGLAHASVKTVAVEDTGMSGVFDAGAGNLTAPPMDIEWKDPYAAFDPSNDTGFAYTVSGADADMECFMEPLDRAWAVVDDIVDAAPADGWPEGIKELTIWQCRPVAVAQLIRRDVRVECKACAGRGAVTEDGEPWHGPGVWDVVEDYKMKTVPGFER